MTFKLYLTFCLTTFCFGSEDESGQRMDHTTTGIMAAGRSTVLNSSGVSKDASNDTTSLHTTVLPTSINPFMIGPEQIKKIAKSSSSEFMLNCSLKHE